MLVLGPPRGGKTTAVIVPSILAAPGPVVTTSTKRDVFDATALARSLLISPATDVWVFDPTGGATPHGARQLRWSPVSAAARWDGALATARAMVRVADPGKGSTDATHWNERAGALLGPLLHAAAVSGASMRDVVRWTKTRNPAGAAEILSSQGPALAVWNLEGIVSTEHREQSSIWSAADGALAAYDTEGALEATDDPNFDASLFVRPHRSDERTPRGLEAADSGAHRWAVNGTHWCASTLYIMAPARLQEQAAPLVVGLLTEITQAAYTRAADEVAERTVMPAVLFALDELANIAPLPSLPSVLSEGAGQGLLVAGCFQDLSQARQRWGEEARGFLTLFGDKMILPGIADQETLRTLSELAGDHDRPVLTRTRSPERERQQLGQRDGEQISVSVQREPRLPPEKIYQGPGPGRTYFLGPEGVTWHWLTRYFETTPWPQLLVRSMEHAAARARLGSSGEVWVPDYQPYELLPSPPLRYDDLVRSGGDELAQRYAGARR